MDDWVIVIIIVVLGMTASICATGMGIGVGLFIRNDIPCKIARMALVKTAS